VALITGGARGIGAGIARTMSAADWDEQLAQDLRTAFVTTKAAIPHLKARRGGAIVNISSITGLVGSATQPAGPGGCEGRNDLADEEPGARLCAA
jgi:NAD(P)-dependent dehydrogenase (short-subunit alcohol dehydrogenase family)